MEVNYKNTKRYNTAKYPIRQPLIITWLISVLSAFALIGKRYKVEKINMEGLKPPYFLLSNHMYFIDFELLTKATGMHRINNVVSIDGYYRRPWLLTLSGAICTRKYTMDLHLIKSINRVIRRGDVLSMYPEARYSPCGIRSYIPESVGKLIKKNGVPVVVAIHRGNHLHSPFWNFRKKRKVPMHTTLTQILTSEQIKAMSADKIYETLIDAFYYDDYKYQKDNAILIKEPYRAEGLHKVLYQCPHCLTEHKMASSGAEIYCEECKKRWVWEENGDLRALSGETEFTHIPDWFQWEREQVKFQIENGDYNFADEVEVYSLPRCWRFIKLGKAKLTHDEENGFVLKGHYRGKDYKIQRKPIQSNSLHIEYDYCYIKPFDCVDISTEDDSYYCYPKKQNIVTKLAFATEILYERSLKEKQKV